MGQKRQKTSWTLWKEIIQKGRCQGYWEIRSLATEKRFYAWEGEKWAEVLQTWTWKHVRNLWQNVFVEYLSIKIQGQKFQSEEDQDYLDR